jgi:glycosyltransferase involved in cell wall biosynthesis
MKKKILIIGQSFPYPLLSGGHQAFFNSVDVLRHDFEIHLLFVENEQSKKYQKTLQNIWSEVKFHPYRDRKFKNIKEFLIRLSNKISKIIHFYCSSELEFLTCVRYYSNDYLNYINNVISENQIDIVQLEFVPNLSLVAALPKSVKTVFIHHELRFVCHELIIKEQNLTSIPFYKYQYSCLKAEELSFLSLYDAVITLSDIDAQKLKMEGLSAQKIHSSFATVRNENIATNSFTDFNNRLTFVGLELHQPNRTGMEWFLDCCWSEILKNDNKMQLKIIGNWSAGTQKLWKSKYKNIEFAGFVENLYEALAGSIMIVPITIGSGIRMKILEAVKMKIPFVTTEIGVEGLPFIDGEDCFIGNDATDFAGKIMKLKNSVAQQRQFVASAYRKAGALFSPEKLKESRISVYKSILEN